MAQQVSRYEFNFLQEALPCAYRLNRAGHRNNNMKRFYIKEVGA